MRNDRDASNVQPLARIGVRLRQGISVACSAATSGKACARFDRSLARRECCLTASLLAGRYHGGPRAACTAFALQDPQQWKTS
ncbi:hypothetical protein ACU10_04465 [Xanthomonas oryzae pv. oryzicola]|nr:hypothetical protein ACU13_04485 [Xanthomonas oryzae pv. oryzicola]AKN96145.1 hypothetical protein ACU10_04465 [Xanthomonas oryzae pv. oryzicola]AKO11367.1 hypothetical protein ACU14_04445 [Xanthomonas oryzae pv. oryzicola]AKO15106.1 hypothetical protein ACU12_04480 [Xanthomonas oryzae pv. oryzicola]QEO98933.1 hypothetical protein XOCgx_3946 [Xanthomonas oryzae pv. oryzicola]